MIFHNTWGIKKVQNDETVIVTLVSKLVSKLKQRLRAGNRA